MQHREIEEMDNLTERKTHSDTMTFTAADAERLRHLEQQFEHHRTLKAGHATEAVEPQGLTISGGGLAKLRALIIQRENIVQRRIAGNARADEIPRINTEIASALRNEMKAAGLDLAAPPAAKTPRLLNIDQVMQRTGLTARVIFGTDFPQPIKHGTDGEGWLNSEVVEWMNNQPGQHSLL